VKFSEVSRAFALIEPVQSRLEMTRMLAELLQKATASEASMICKSVVRPIATALYRYPISDS